MALLGAGGSNTSARLLRHHQRSDRYAGNPNGFVGTVLIELVDLFTIEKRMDAGYYKSLEQFLADLKLMVTNCKTYNDENTIYYKAADGLNAAVVRALKHQINIIPGA